MKGKIVSYLASKKFGFVNGEDGESYFLHVTSLIHISDESKLVKGVVIEFDPVPTSKGLAARKVKIPTVYFKKQLVDFFVSKDEHPKHGVVVKRFSIQTRFFKDINIARDHIKKLALDASCNSILNLNFEKTTFSEGNYQYTVHAFKADFALVTESVPCDDQAEELNSSRYINHQIEVIDSKFNEVSSLESKARAAQFEGDNNGCLYLFLIVLGLYLYNLVG